MQKNWTCWTKDMDRDLAHNARQGCTIRRMAKKMGLSEDVIKRRIAHKGIAVRAYCGNRSFEIPLKQKMKPEDANKLFIQLLWKHHRDYYVLATSGPERVITKG